MRHKKQQVKLGRVQGPKKALLRALTESFINHGHIKTTEAKAKVLRRVVEPLITKAKVGGLTAFRAAKKFLYTEKAIKKLINEIGPKYTTRSGGYTRIIKLPSRKNDAAKMARIELV
jgi:large subunit ribosomal protein L17